MRMHGHLRALVVGLAVLAMVATPVEAVGAEPTGVVPLISVDALIGSCTIRGQTVVNTTFKVTHRASAGTLKARTQVTSDGSGAWVRPCPGPRVATGDRLEFRLIGATEPFRTFKVPALTAVTDRAFDRIRGTAPGVSTVGVALGWCDPTGNDCFLDSDDTVNVASGTRRFQWNPGVPMNGLSIAYVLWAKGDDRVALRQEFAHVVVRIGSSRVVGFGPRRGTVETISLRRGDRLGLTTPRTRPDAGFRGTFKRNGATMKVRAGDLISSSVAGDASMLIPNVFLNVTGAGSNGRCFRGQLFGIVIRDAAGVSQAHDAQNTLPNGTWSYPFAMNAGWTADVWCVNRNGDQVHLRGVAN